MVAGFEWGHCVGYHSGVTSGFHQQHRVPHSDRGALLGLATLVDLGLVLDDRIFRQRACNRQDKPGFANGGVP